uniref:Uncharacterized protein n=1 Tax=Physcomitrium patens TaxID=3218 RepID=A0A7I3ZS99_PHYPA
MVPLSMHSALEGQEVIIRDDEYFLNSEGGKSPRFPKSPGMFGKSPSMFAKSPGRSHKRRHSTGLSGFLMPMSSHPQGSRLSS